MSEDHVGEEERDSDIYAFADRGSTESDAYLLAKDSLYSVVVVVFVLFDFLFFVLFLCSLLAELLISVFAGLL